MAQLLRHPALSRPALPASQMLDATGFCILHDLVPPSVIEAIADDFSGPFEETPFCQGDFYGARTKRFGRLLTRSAHMPRLIEHPDILAIADQVLLPWCECIQLNLAQAIAIYPGALEQLPHRDQDMWRGDIGTREYLLNVMWPIDRFTAENGATRIWPRTHGKAALASDPPGTPPVVARCMPGDAIVFLGSTLHCGGANTSVLPRRAIVVSYSLGWLKPYENPWLAYPPSVARHFSPELAALVGYRQHRPNLGNFEGQCPSVLLRDGDAGPMAAIDALRSDQTVLLAEHVARQRASAGQGS